MITIVLSCIFFATSASVGVSVAGAQEPAIQDSGLDVEQHQLSLTPGWDLESLEASDVDGHALLVASSPAGAVLQVTNEPTMVILDTQGEAASFALRSKNDDTWSDWVTVETATDEAPDGVAGGEGEVLSVSAIGPIWLGDHTNEIEIVSLSGDLDELQVETLRGNGSTLVAEAGPLAANAPGAPTIRARSDWAEEGWAYGNEGCASGPSYADNVRAVVIHHTVTTNNYSQSQVVDLMRGIYRLHVKVNGWCDIGYNLLVDRFGTLWEGRSGGIDKPVIGGHARGFNTWTSGVAVLGQHQSGASPSAAVPSTATLNAISAFASWKLGLHGIDPHGTTWLKSRTKATSLLRYPDETWVEVPTIIGHRDLGYTSCPGSHTYSRLGSVRSAATRDTDPSAQFVAHQPNLSGPAFLSVDVLGGVRAGGAAAYPTPAPTLSAGTIAIDAAQGQGFALANDGTLAGFGGASTPTPKPAGARQAVDLALTNGAGNGYVLASDGALFAIQTGSSVDSQTTTSADPAVALDLNQHGVGYVVTATGTLLAVGDTPARSLTTSVVAVDVGVRNDGQSGWVLDNSGRLHPFGGAPAWQRHGGSFNGIAIALAIAPDDSSGWILDSEGRVDVFGINRPAAPLSTTVGQHDAVDLAVWWELRSEFLQTDVAQYSSALVEVFLGREADLAELDRLGWIADFEGRAQLADQLANSDEWAGEIVEANYLDVLGRAPDASGRAYWVAQLNSGMRTQDLGSYFYSSPEYVANSGSNAGYVTRLYAALLHRDAEGEGLDYWVGLLDSGSATPGEIAAGFYSSIESRNDRVSRLYWQILGRGAGEEGTAYWSDRLLREDDIDLAVNLAVSDEFFDRVTG